MSLEISKVAATQAFFAAVGPLAVPSNQWLNMTFTNISTDQHVVLMTEYIFTDVGATLYANLYSGVTGNLPTTLIDPTRRDFRGPPSSIAETKYDISANPLTGTLRPFKLPIIGKTLFSGLGLPIIFGPNQGTNFSIQSPAGGTTNITFGMYYAESA